MFLVTILAVLTVMAVLNLEQQKRHEKERADLLDRIMSRDFNEYKTNAAPIAQSDPVYISDEEEWAREIEAKKMG